MNRFFVLCISALALFTQTTAFADGPLVYLVGVGRTALNPQKTAYEYFLRVKDNWMTPDAPQHIALSNQWLAENERGLNVLKIYGNLAADRVVPISLEYHESLAGKATIREVTIHPEAALLPGAESRVQQIIIHESGNGSVDLKINGVDTHVVINPTPGLDGSTNEIDPTRLFDQSAALKKQLMTVDQLQARTRILLDAPYFYLIDVDDEGTGVNRKVSIIAAFDKTGENPVRIQLSNEWIQNHEKGLNNLKAYRDLAKTNIVPISLEYKTSGTKKLVSEISIRPDLAVEIKPVKNEIYRVILSENGKGSTWFADMGDTQISGTYSFEVNQIEALSKKLPLQPKISTSDEVYYLSNLLQRPLDAKRTQFEYYLTVKKDPLSNARPIEIKLHPFWTANGGASFQELKKLRDLAKDHVVPISLTYEEWNGKMLMSHIEIRTDVIGGTREKTTLTHLAESFDFPTYKAFRSESIRNTLFFVDLVQIGTDRYVTFKRGLYSTEIMQVKLDPRWYANEKAYVQLKNLKHLVNSGKAVPFTYTDIPNEHGVRELVSIKVDASVLGQKPIYTLFSPGGMLAFDTPGGNKITDLNSAMRQLSDSLPTACSILL